MNFGGYGGMYIFHRTFFSLLSKETEKVQEHELYLNPILYHFDLIFFL